MKEQEWNACVRTLQAERVTRGSRIGRAAVAGVPLWRMLAATCLAFLGAAGARGSVVQEFYLPMPEAQVYEAFNKQAAYDPTDVEMTAVFSIVVTTPGAVVTYDHWEDGYEADINAPVSASTQVWGDGNNANGICPGFANDPLGLPAGTVISLQNNIPAPVRGAAVLYDGGDRIGTTKPVTVTRVCYESYYRGTAQASAVEVISTLDRGSRYIAPVGTDVPANGMFTYVDLLVMADEDGTTVHVDSDGTGTSVTAHMIDRGAFGAFLVDDIKKGATVSSDKPVQVHMITGNAFNGQFETRSFVLRPVELWSDNYIIPVCTLNAAYPGSVFLFNTNAAPLAVTYTTRSGGGPLVVPAANGVLRFDLPEGSATLLASDDGSPFFAICAMNTDPVGYGGADYDWGFAPMPFDGLTPELVCGWGPGADVNNPDFWTGTENGNPVWVTAANNTTLFVDFDGNGLRVTNFPVAALELVKLFDLEDNDQTGMRIYTTDGTVIAGVWGQDPAWSDPGPPYMDMGYALAPFPIAVLTKTVELVVDVTPTNVVNKGDILEYTLRIDNKGLLPLVDVKVVDNLPAQQLEYVEETTFMIVDNAIIDIPDDFPDEFDPDTETPFPLDGVNGYTIPDPILRGQSISLVYRCRIIGTGTIRNGFVDVTNTVQAAVLVSIANSSVVEGNSGETDLVFTVTLDELSENDISVDYSITPGTAAAGVDYVHAQGTLTIPTGTNTGLIVVKVIGDTLVEANESLFVTLSNATEGGSILVGQATGTIIDDDAYVSIANASVVEGNSGFRDLVFNVTLSRTVPLPVTVDYATTPGTATAGGDYLTTQGTLTIPAGSRTGSIRVKVRGDTLVEANETLFVNLSNATGGGSILVGQATGTIIDDDTHVSIARASVVEGNSGFRDLVFNVTLSRAVAMPVTVDFATAPGTATAGVDYLSRQGTLTIPAGRTTGMIVVKVRGDTLIESNETLFVILSNATGGGSILVRFARGTIIDDDFAVNRLLYRVDWVYNPRRDSWYGTLRITNDRRSPKSVTWSVRYSFKRTAAHYLRFPTGRNTAAGPNWFYVDLGPQFRSRIRSVGNRDTFLDPGETVVINTGIEVWGRGAMTRWTRKLYEDRLQAVWVERR